MDPGARFSLFRDPAVRGCASRVTPHTAPGGGARRSPSCTDRLARSLSRSSRRSDPRRARRRDSRSTSKISARTSRSNPIRTSRTRGLLQRLQRVRREPADRLRELGRDVQQRLHRLRRRLLLAGLGLLADHRHHHARLRQPVQRDRGRGRVGQRDLRRRLHGRPGRRAGDGLADHVRPAGVAARRGAHQHHLRRALDARRRRLRQEVRRRERQRPRLLPAHDHGPRRGRTRSRAASSSRSPTTASPTTRSTTS